MRQIGIRSTLATILLGVAGLAQAAEPSNLVMPAYGTYAVTEQGRGEWRVCWQGESAPQRFNGRVYAAAGSRIEATSKIRGLAVAQVADNQVAFDAAAGANEHQCFDVAVKGDFEQVYFDLAINGEQATNPLLVFSTHAPEAVELAALQ